MLLREMPPQARPREKILSLGPQALSDSELLAVLLRTGTKGMDVIELAHQLLLRHGGWSGLMRSHAFERIKGIGNAKRAELISVLEIARRVLASEVPTRPLLNEPQKVRDYLRLHIGSNPRETFVALWLNAALTLIHMEEVSRGTLQCAHVYPREVVRSAIEYNAKAVIFAHNHPGGSTAPSDADRLLTQTLKQALHHVDVQVIDHLIVTQQHTTSLADIGLV